MAMDVSLPEQAIEELMEFDRHYVTLLEARLEVSNLEMYLSAKGMALQQAGIIPLNSDEEFIAASVEAAKQLEGLLIGY